ncbi:tripartite tricarboxylate transporter substrate binding protein [Paroceanicella profunda]|uniref:Tripartite tricarboxylate transporter substrate binding protein n=1 Tax=Paroceanicella profunda TaxID=2579971 RepID=A0A5B8FYE6_9RHOB|nr:tripartite tricarboxylate transporter substrate binding protein [Paroceanicella profunda]QDL91183.1 tripartite tricarboxylate transporter substrate binding protein [Paroceanicella profunda]
MTHDTRHPGGRRGVLLGLALAVAAALLPGAGPAAAQDYPDRPVTIVVPFPPGGSTDLLARKIAEKISGPLGQPVVVENRAGAGGAVGASYVARSDPDGYTLLMGVTGSNAISSVLRDDLPYEPLKDFAPVSLVVSAPLVLVVNADSDFTSVQDVIDYAKAEPQAFTHGSPGIGTSMHLTGELFALETGTELVHVPYAGSAAAMQDLLGRQLDAMFADLLVSSEYIRSGRLRALAVTSAARHPMLPDVPTVAEAGVPGFQATSWQGVFAPAGTPEPVLDTLYKVVTAALTDADLQAFFPERGFMVEGRTPAASQEFIASEIEKWGKVVDAAGLKTN